MCLGQGPRRACVALEFAKKMGQRLPLSCFLRLGKRIGQSRAGPGHGSWLAGFLRPTNTNHGERESPPNKQSALLVPVGRPLFVCARNAVGFGAAWLCVWRSTGDVGKRSSKRRDEGDGYRHVASDAVEQEPAGRGQPDRYNPKKQLLRGRAIV